MLAQIFIRWLDGHISHLYCCVETCLNDIEILWNMSAGGMSKCNLIFEEINWEWKWNNG